MNEKILIYQIFTRLFGNRNETRKEWGTLEDNGSGKFSDFDQKTLKYIKQMGFSHVWYTGVIRHATQTDYTENGIPMQHPAIVKGKAGSPYSICDYYDVDPDLADDVDNRMKEFESLITRSHKAGLKVIIDFVPNHVARQYHSIKKPAGVIDLGADDNKDEGFNPQNNFYYCPGEQFSPTFDIGDYVEIPAVSTGNDHFDSHPGVNDWYETVKLNYGIDYFTRYGHFDPIPDTWHKMEQILFFWASKGVDGFRCDMAEMVPSAFWSWVTEKVKYRYPELIFIGEVYDPNQYRTYIHSGFDYLYDKVGMYDTMRNVICNYRSACDITPAWQSVNDIGNHMLYFLENHDEQRVASDYFAGSGLRAIPGLAASVLMRSNPFMLYAAEEFGERGMDKEGFSGRDGRTTIFDYWSIDTLCRAAKHQLTNDEKLVFWYHWTILRIARTEKAIDGDFYDLMYANPWSEKFDNYKQFAFLRKKDKEFLLVVCNFSDTVVDIEVNIPQHALDFLSIPARNYEATDLITNEHTIYSIEKDKRVKMDIYPYSVRVWKMRIRNLEVSKKNSTFASRKQNKAQEQ